ncbi:MAG TPA: FHA domain-containing serine/threonine-protein kinase, partial [Chloroflexaceae bacterium]|nr:FHA domain-containing serine/threonine-protein kinase [Chloroflexaceae bacterium]
LLASEAAAKPGENIMISPREGVKVIDFGIARVLGAATRTRDGMLIGTPVYMSFEQANGDTVNPTSDLYAAAIVLYELLTGKVPFSAEDPTEVVLQHRRLQPLPPRQLNPDISPQVEAAILRALEKDVRRRHQTAQAFAAALGCAPGQPLPPDLSAAAARLALPVQNERGNAVNLPTRFPQAAVAATPRGHRLRVQSGTRRGQVIPLLHGACVGRSEIDPADGTISRQHLRVEAQSGACVVYDISSHGTAINGARLAPGTPCRLAPGAIVQVGQTVLVYEAAP